jgi:phospholipid/cholesterol/gamma-HCH transport system substrate-binding protein
MTRDDKALEVKVGLFIAVGIAFIAVMVFKFGSVGQGFGGTYEITVDFPSADGLIKNSDVKLAGALIGYVSKKPEISRNVGTVALPLSIQEHVRIPRGSHFRIGSSGLLGDRYVDVVPDDKFDPNKFNPDDPSQTINPGTKVEGEKTPGLDELQKKGVQVLDQLNEEIAELKTVTGKVKDDVLGQQNLDNIKETIANLKSTSQNFNSLSKNLGTTVQNAQGTIESANKTLGTINSAAGDLKPAIADLRKLFAQGQDFLKSANDNNGLLYLLLHDRKTTDNLRALIDNLREHGVLFYHDTAEKRAAEKPRR